MNPQQSFNNFAPVQPTDPSAQKSKLMFIGLGALLLLSIVLVFVSMLNRGGPDSLFAQSIGMHKEQLRLARLADDFSEADDELVQLQSNLVAIVTSDLISLQAAYGKEVNDKQIASLMDPEAQARFTEAGQTNSFTAEYKQTMSSVIKSTTEDLGKLRTEVKTSHLETVDTAIANQKALLAQLDKL